LGRLLLGRLQRLLGKLLLARLLGRLLLARLLGRFLLGGLGDGVLRAEEAVGGELGLLLLDRLAVGQRGEQALGGADRGRPALAVVLVARPLGLDLDPLAGLLREGDDVLG